MRTKMAGDIVQFETIRCSRAAGRSQTTPGIRATTLACGRLAHSSRYAVGSKQPRDAGWTLEAGPFRTSAEAVEHFERLCDWYALQMTVRQEAS